MNPTDLRALLTDEPVSRTTFFTQLLTVPSASSHSLSDDELAPDSLAAADSVVPAAAEPPATTGFPA
ncbi:hypothetical protein GCM10027594_05060 [Hymenobacter agri]